MIVVADTTPLLYLSRIRQIELLRVLYQQIHVPATVWHEAVVARPDAAGVELLRSAGWIVVSDRAERAGLERELEEALDPARRLRLRWRRFWERSSCSSMNGRAAQPPENAA